LDFLERVVLNLENTMDENIKFLGMCQICWRGSAESFKWWYYWQIRPYIRVHYNWKVPFFSKHLK